MTNKNNSIKFDVKYKSNGISEYMIYLILLIYLVFGSVYFYSLK